MAPRWDSSLPYWETVVQPLLAAAEAGPIVEIGAARGATTAKLAELAAERGVVLHSIDPDPQFDVADFERRYGHLRFHRKRSHAALEEIEDVTAAVIDGDHNWFTVHGELKRLEGIAANAGRHFPLALLHDVEWPYARRDLYYEPDAIPAKWRHQWDRRGIVWGQRQLAENDAGINPHLANALVEGGPRNGVLTAIEDFVGDSSDNLELLLVPGRAGVGVLASPSLLDDTPPLRHEWDRLHSCEFLLKHAESLAEDAVRAMANEREAQRKAEY